MRLCTVKGPFGMGGGGGLCTLRNLCELLGDFVPLRILLELWGGGGGQLCTAKGPFGIVEMGLGVTLYT